MEKSEGGGRGQEAGNRIKALWDTLSRCDRAQTLPSVGNRRDDAKPGTKVERGREGECVGTEVSWKGRKYKGGGGGTCLNRTVWSQRDEAKTESQFICRFFLDFCFS